MRLAGALLLAALLACAAAGGRASSGPLVDGDGPPKQRAAAPPQAREPPQREPPQRRAAGKALILPLEKHHVAATAALRKQLDSQGARHLRKARLLRASQQGVVVPSTPVGLALYTLALQIGTPPQHVRAVSACV